MTDTNGPGGTGYDDTASPGGPLMSGDQLAHDIPLQNA